MDNFVPIPYGQVPNGWQHFVLSGSLTFDPSIDTYWGAPSLRMWSDGGTFVAGVFHQIGGLTPGITYRASMGWGAPTKPDAFGRRLGIDPTGGADPNAGSVVWGPMWRGPGPVTNDDRPGFPNVDVTAVARSATVTVFVWVDHNYSMGVDEIFIDAVGLYADTTVPVPVDTPTAVPQPVQTQPTRLPVQAPPPTATRTATATATATATETATPTVTPTPSPTATASATATPTVTATPSVTPSSTLPPRPPATAAPTQEVRAATVERPGGLLFGGLGALAGAGLLGGVVVRLRRNR
jgi:hypothetical protein